MKRRSEMSLDLRLKLSACSHTSPEQHSYLHQYLGTHKRVQDSADIYPPCQRRCHVCCTAARHDARSRALHTVPQIASPHRRGDTDSASALHTVPRLRPNIHTAPVPT